MTPEREAAIVRLLETQNDNLPIPGRRETLGASGFVHGARTRSCPDCIANGGPIIGCETCGGSGIVAAGNRDRLAVVDDDIEFDLAQPTDPYAKGDGFFHGGSQHDRNVAINHAIAAAERDLRRFPGFRPQGLEDELAEANANPETWERARRAMYRAYDYAALDRALEQLHSQHPGVSAYSDLGIAFLNEHLPDPLRAPGATDATELRALGKVERSAGSAALEVRNARIRAMAGEGAKPGEIAAACHVSIRTVYLVCKEAA
jgi:hypothetical protein